MATADIGLRLLPIVAVVEKAGISRPYVWKLIGQGHLSETTAPGQACAGVEKRRTGRVDRGAHRGAGHADERSGWRFGRPLRQAGCGPRGWAGRRETAGRCRTLAYGGFSNRERRPDSRADPVSGQGQTAP